MTTVTERIKALKPGEKFFSFEFFPPKTDTGFRNLLARLHRMMALNPLFITVTWGAGGSTSEKSLDLAATCQKELGVTTVLHLTCTNTNKEVIDNALMRAKEAGIRNILALRGDPPRTQEYWTPNCDFKNAVDLVRYIKSEYQDYFCIGVAGYPEGHVDGANEAQQSPNNDLPYLVEKVKAGAEFIITQLFFDVDKFIAYENLLQSVPELSTVTLVPGLMPITTYNVFIRATKLSHSSVPQSVYSKLEAHRSDDDMVKSIGIDILIQMISEINAKTGGRVRGYHFYTLNLEKAVAYIIEQSSVLSNIPNDNSNDHEEAIASDSDSEAGPNGQAEGGFSSANPGGNGKLATVNENNSKGRKAIIDISTGKGSLGKDATWDEFPNGRFGDSNSPAYGEIDGYGPSLKLQSSEQIIRTWGSPESVKDVTKLFMEYLSGKIKVLPWGDSEISSETALIQEQLFDINQRGWFTLASQPAVNGCTSRDNVLGWGPPNGFLFQKAFVEFFIPKKEWDEDLSIKLKPLLDNKTLTYFRGDNSGELKTNLPVGAHNHNRKTAVTWGVFPSKEVVQPTVIDYESFKAWNEEAFLLWLEWARCYKMDSKTYNFLHNVYKNYYLISVIHHDFTDEYGLWRTLIES